MSDTQQNAEQRIAEIAARAEKATPGPMTVITRRGGEPFSNEYFWCVKVGAWDSTLIERREDAEFYAEARADIPWLLDQLSALRAANAKMIEEQRCAKYGMVRAPAKCSKCGVTLDAPTTGMVGDRCPLGVCGGRMEAIAPPSPAPVVSSEPSP